MASQSLAASRSASSSTRLANAWKPPQQLGETAFIPTQGATFSRQHKLGSTAFREKREQMRVNAKLASHGPAEPTSGQRRGSVRTHFASECVADSASSGDELSKVYSRGPYIAEAAVGMVVCSARGCRPVFLDSVESAEQSRGNVCTEERPEESLPTKKKPAYPDGFVDYLKEVWLEKDVAQRLYEKELRQNPRSAKILASYAAFAHKEQNDVALADRLYRQALQEAPDNADVLSSYALFLWQTEA